MSSLANQVLTRQGSQANEETSELKIAIEKACREQGVRLRSQLSPRESFWFKEEQNPVPGWIAKLPRKRTKSLLGITGSVANDSSRSISDGITHEQPYYSETNFKDRLKKATELDIRPDEFSWKNLTCICRSEHMQGGTDEDDNAPVAVDGAEAGEAAACIKFAPSRLATQSEILGLELARHLGVLTPQARVVHCGTNEWSTINFAVEEVQKNAKEHGNEILEATCGELLEALTLSRCLLIMGYIDGDPLLQTQPAFSDKSSEMMTAAALGRVMLLDLVLRNEDRLECQQLGWRGNSGNLLASERPPLGKLPGKNKDSKSVIPRSRPKGEKRSSNINLLKQSKSHSEMVTPGRTSTRGSIKRESLPRSAWTGSQQKLGSVKMNSSLQSNDLEKSAEKNLYVVAIDSGVPRRPPSMKAEKDKADYPKFVEMLLNDETTASEILKEISGNKFGIVNNENTDEQDDRKAEVLHQKKIVRAFQEGFRAGAHDMQDLRMFLLKLFRLLNQLLREVVEYMANYEEEEDLILASTPPSRPPSHQNSTSSDSLSVSTSSTALLHQNVSEQETRSPNVQGGDIRSKLEKLTVELNNEDSAAEDSATEEKDSVKGLPKRRSFLARKISPGRGDSPSSGRKSSPRLRDSWSDKLTSVPANPSHLGMRLTLKLKDVDKYAKFDGELNKQLDHWNDKFRTECRKICKDQHFTSGFTDKSTNHSLIDSYELKVRLDHLLERMALIVQGIQTDRPSCVVKHLYIGGVVAARSFHTLQHLGITHILCLCPNEYSIEAEYADLYEFKSFQIKDEEDEDISRFFDDACTFIDSIEKAEGVLLVHCFEGKSRSAAVVLAYLMKRKGHTLLQAWALLKAIHPRAQPNDGFMRSLVQLDMKLHGKVSMDWKQRRPEVRMCPICGRSAGISNVSLRSHLQRFHSGVKHVHLTTVPSPEAEEIKAASPETELKLEKVLSVLSVGP